MRAKKLTKAKIELRIEQINDARIDALQNLAEEVREQFVVPMCKKAKMDYVTGNGDFFFTTGRHEKWIGSVADAVLEEKTYMIPTIDILDIVVGRDDYLGYYITDVDKDSV